MIFFTHTHHDGFLVFRATLDVAYMGTKSLQWIGKGLTKLVDILSRLADPARQADALRRRCDLERLVATILVQIADSTLSWAIFGDNSFKPSS